MSDALVSTAVGGTMLVATVGVATYSVKKLKKDEEIERKIPIMGVVGAFVFAAQMINFSIPGTGSSGHIGGGLLLSAVLGPWGGFLTMAAILLVQALFFGDGGLLAYGCNVINMGFFGCIVGYNIIFKAIVKIVNFTPHKGYFEISVPYLVPLNIFKAIELKNWEDIILIIINWIIFFKILTLDLVVIIPPVITTTQLLPNEI